MTVALDSSLGAATGDRTTRTRSKHFTPGNLILVVLVGLLAVGTLFPFYWSLRTAFSTNESLAAHPRSLLPTDFSLGGFERALGLATAEESIAAGGSGAEINFLNALKNSMIVAVLVTIGQVVCCGMAAYAFARLHFPGRDKLFLVVLGALMVPPIFTTLPNFILIRDLDLLNTHLGIAAPTLLMTPFAIFFLRQFFLGISREVEEAALIDGAGRFRICFRVIMPMAASPIATLALLTFIEQWNAYLWPRLVGQDESVRVLTASLGYFVAQTPQGTPDWAGLMAATWVSLLPVLILLLLTGRRLVNSIQFSGIK